MKPLLIQLDEQTLVALNRVAAPDKRKRSEFIRQAIRQAIRRAEFRAMRDAYRKQPDLPLDVDDWLRPRNRGGKRFEIWWVNFPAPAGRRRCCS